ncbi:probable metal-nicotianamine transporter YSL7 [Andrographis paniculata]|uniref:probable metal-nicotianamine transporter YSL7 n=1 Tax=Andrographis paniculata TaxID=175694 RepID=UPI0021E99185|nr:probable metal-nicotianamine transporter YSL7 [Andrographis paniculata]
MKLHLTVGIVPSLNVSAGLLGFFSVKIWATLLEKWGLLEQPFTRQENAVIQTCIITSSGLVFSGGFGSYLFGMSSVVANQSSEANNPLDVKNPALPWMILFLFIISFIGLFSAIPLRKIMIVDFKLPYPSGTATAHLINSFHTPLGAELAKFYFDFSATYVGVGMITPLITNVSLLFGAVLSWGLIWPLVATRKGHWYSAEIDEKNLRGLEGYKVFIAISMILGAGLYNLLKILCKISRGLYKTFRCMKPVAALPDVPSISETSYDDARRTQMFLKDQIPAWIAAIGYIGFVAVSTISLPYIFKPLRWYYIVVIYMFAPVLAFCNSYGCGITDFNLASMYAKLAIFVISSWAGASNNGVLAGLAMGGVMMNIVAVTSSLMQDCKTGYMTLASPRSMFISQIIGTAIGCVLSPCIFWLFLEAFEDLGKPDSQYAVPYALIFRNVAILGVNGFSSLPHHCLTFCYAFFIVSITITGIRDFLKPKWARFVPIPMAMALPFFLGANFAVDMCVGSLILVVWKKVDKAAAKAFGTVVASGLICGDGIWTLPSSILAMAGVKPPICMKFVSRLT